MIQSIVWVTVFHQLEIPRYAQDDTMAPRSTNDLFFNNHIIKKILIFVFKFN